MLIHAAFKESVLLAYQVHFKSNYQTKPHGRSDFNPIVT